MLDIDNALALSEFDWEQLPSRAELPVSWQAYTGAAGAVQTKADSTRQFCRIGLKSIAIAWVDDDVHAIFAKDVSRIGMGFYAPVHLLPRAIVRVWLPGRSLLTLRMSRCKRLGDRCFECGALFEVGNRTRAR